MHFLAVPHISIFDVTVTEQDGSVTVPFNRTGGDISSESRVEVSTRDVVGNEELFDWAPTNHNNLCSYGEELVQTAKF